MPTVSNLTHAVSRAAGEAQALDVAVYAAVATTPTPALDVGLRRLSSVADRSVLWLLLAAAMASLDGPRGKRAATEGLLSIGAASALTNLVLKFAGRRARPDRAGAGVPLARHVDMPGSTSFPSGHAASAFAFATGAGHVLPAAAAPLRFLAAAVAYSRVHTGVHYPADVIVGAIVGASAGMAVGADRGPELSAAQARGLVRTRAKCGACAIATAVLGGDAVAILRSRPPSRLEAARLNVATAALLSRGLWRVYRGRHPWESRRRRRR